MIGKLFVWATTREFAVERMRRALDEYKITGVKTNIAYLGSILELPELVGGITIRPCWKRMPTGSLCNRREEIGKRLRTWP